MKTIALCLSLWLGMTGCGGEPASADAVIDSPTPTPPELTQKFDSLLNGFEKDISTQFWTDDNFDMDAYAGYMKKKGLTKIPNSLMDYNGMVDSVNVTILHTTTSSEKGGWNQQFSIRLKDSIFAKQKEFAVTR